MYVSAIIVANHLFTMKEEFEDVNKEWFCQGGQRLVRDQKKIKEMKSQAANVLDI